MIAKIKKALIALIVTMTVTLSVPVVTVVAGPCKGDDNFFIPTWYAGLCDSSQTTIQSPGDYGKSSTNAQQGTQTGSTQATQASLGGWFTKLAANIVTILLYVVGYVSLGFIIYGGFLYMTSGDNSSGTASARKTIQNAVIGLVISIVSVAIVKVVATVVQ